MFTLLLLWSMLILPWFVLIPLKSYQVKRFFPAGLFGALLLTVVFQMADAFDWWKVTRTIPLFTNITSFVYGLFLVGTIVILYFTYGHFWRYFITNLVVDAFLAFLVSPWFEYLGIYELHRIHPLGVYFITTILSVLTYLYMKWQDGVMAK